jgi:hypothetical protein
MLPAKTQIRRNNLTGRSYTNLLQYFSKDRSERIFPHLFCEITITLIPTPGKDITRIENCRYLVNVDEKCSIT